MLCLLLQVLVWHTRTEKPHLANEPKVRKDSVVIEVWGRSLSCGRSLRPTWGRSLRPDLGAEPATLTQLETLEFTNRDHSRLWFLCSSDVKRKKQNVCLKKKEVPCDPSSSLLLLLLLHTWHHVLLWFLWADELRVHEAGSRLSSRFNRSGLVSVPNCCQRACLHSVKCWNVEVTLHHFGSSAGFLQLLV